MSLRLLFPSDPLNRKKPDEIYAAVHAAARRLGIALSVSELETLDASGLRAHPAIEMGDVLVYRGWMLDAA